MPDAPGDEAPARLLPVIPTGESPVFLRSTPSGGVCATIQRTPEGWIAVDGTLNADGSVTPGETGLFVNGRRVEGYTVLAHNDILRLADDSFIFVEPMGPETGLELGPAWMRRRESDGNLVAFASFRGIIDKYPENQDRAFYRIAPDGSVTAGVADGMGGHASGERSAEIGRRSYEDAIDAGLGLDEAVDAMNRDMYAGNQARGEHGGAVFAGVRLHPDGRIEARTVGDGEVIVMSLPADRSSGLRLDFWSTRPSVTQAREYHLPTLPDGRVVLGRERTLRLDPDSNVVDAALGLHNRPMKDRQWIDWIDTEPGRIYFAISMTDGLSEQYITHQELTGVVDAYVLRTGDLTPEGIRDALMRDALIRCSLARMAYREGRPFAITPSAFARAYREMTLEMDDVAGDPPDNLPVWSYQGDYFMIPAGGTAYVVRGVVQPDGGVLPDPDVVSTTTGRLLIENPALRDHPSLVGRFKQDNVSLAVVAFERTPEA
jgi:hypothetical protein